MPLVKVQSRGTENVGGGNRNFVQNGAMLVSQRSTQTTGLGASSGYFTLDRFRYGQNSRDEAVLTMEQASDAPSGFSKSFKLTTTTPESAIDADNLFWIEQRFEGQDITGLKNGTSDAVTTTLSFQVKSSITGTFGVSLYKPENTARIINATYTINSADTWESKTITFAGDTSGGGTNNDNTEALRVIWHLASGSNYDSTNSTSWADYSTTNWAGGHAQDGVITTSNATWQLTGVQYEIGEQASDFQFESFGETVSRCQRYYFKIQADGSADTFAMGSVINTTTTDHNVSFPVQMRESPTAIETSGTASDYNTFTNGTAYNNTSVPSFTRATTMTAYYRTTVTSSLTAGRAGIHRANNADAFLAWSADL